MFIFGNFLIAVAQILGIIFTILYWLILIRALISWVNPDPYNPIVQFLNRTTEPILTPIRRYMPRMAVDFSPIIAFLLIIFLRVFLVGSLYDMGNRLKYEDRFRNTSPRIQVQAPQKQQPSELEEPLPSDQLFN